MKTPYLKKDTMLYGPILRKSTMFAELMIFYLSKPEFFKCKSLRL